MVDKVSVTSHHSYGSRLGDSLKSIIGGIIAVIIAIVILVMNENNYVEEKKALEEGASIVQEAVADKIDPDLEGKEIHVSGETTSNDEALKDDIFGIITDDLKLKRTVEMYQWYEEEHESCTDNYGGSEDCTTTYTYDTKWSDSPISSSDFNTSNGHENPTSREFESKTQEKSPITLGAYTLTTIFIDKLTNYKTINLSEQNVITPEKYQLIAEKISDQTGSNSVEDNNNSYLYGDTNKATTDTHPENFHILNDYIYIGADPSKPTIGDLKITFSSVKPGTVSIIGKQAGNDLRSYTATNGRSIALLDEGNVPAEDMFKAAQDANKMMTWIIRFIGLLIMYFGFAAMFKFIETLAKIIPFLANIIGVGTSIIALGLTIVVGFLTIGIAWLAVRPIIGISCLVIAAGGIFLLVKSKKGGKKEEKPEIVEQPKE